MNDKAAVDRGREEVEILEAEHDRQIKSYRKYMEVWAGISGDMSQANKPGSQAYAMKRRQLYSFLLAETQRQWDTSKEAALAGIALAESKGAVADLAANYGKHFNADHERRQEIAHGERALQDLANHDM